MLLSWILVILNAFFESDWDIREEQRLSGKELDNRHLTEKVNKDKRN